MRPVAYARPDDAASAVALVGRTPGARYLGGGTNLVDLMKLGVETPALLVDVTGLGMDDVADDISDGGVGLRIGANARNSDLAADRRVRERFPVLSQALLSGASGQLRNIATTGGNLLQRTRCAYFTDATKPCNKRLPGTGCPAREGEHRNLAVLGASEHCIATHPSDLVVALSALDAEVTVEEPGGTRTVSIHDLYRPVGDTPHLETTLADGALITAVTLRPLPDGARSRYRKVRERASYAFAIGSVAAVLSVHDGAVSDVRVALGAVASHPWRARHVERALVGQPFDGERLDRALDDELAATEPLRDNAYKLPLVRALAHAMLAELWQEAR
jgi:xanthine dehydrogenase YagS FAD-binding subunit